MRARLPFASPGAPRLSQQGPARALVRCQLRWGLPHLLTRRYVRGSASLRSLAFMLPVATPPNAVAYATGLVPLSSMLRRGLVLNAVGVALVGVLVPSLGPLVFQLDF